MAHDRAESDVLPLTQEFVSMMLAMRRPGVTVAARSLQNTGAIEYERGRIKVRDRTRLEEAFCECYGIVRKQFQRLLGWPASRPQDSINLGQKCRVLSDSEQTSRAALRHLRRTGHVTRASE